MASSLPRRSVLAGGLALGAGAATVALGPTAPALAVPKPRPGRMPYPFLLGVASGDPSPDGVVLWTRLALDPLAPDGFAGLTAEKYDLEFQVATEPQFRNVVRRGTKHARRKEGYSVHVELTGLPSGTELYYRFRVDEHISPVGRTLTAPALGSAVSQLRMAFASCSSYATGYFTAYRRLAEDYPDLVLHLGDYIYESGGRGVRQHSLARETFTLADYRVRYAQYHSDPDLQAAHQVAPWMAVNDDHEVENNFAGDIAELAGNAGVTREQFRMRRAAAYQAYYENLPFRRAQTPKGPDMQIYRRVGWGALAAFHMLDTRQFRDDQAANGGLAAPNAESLDPARSILGARQERWLMDGLGRSQATWDVLGQQVFFAQTDFAAGPGLTVNMDAWDGYAASRNRVLAGFQERGVANPVVLTGDIHTHWANELKADFSTSSSRTVGVELVCTSITSNGDGTETPSFGPAVMAENPHIKFAGNRRGYVLTSITPDELRADFRALDYVTRADAPVRTQATFVVEAGNPGLNPG
ncbi:alkaline phosphatase D family protein [Motilibacter aurantiacus]|uniref:alkaline phosphatase D family protein n=1 Tax=Motilibacter aurantiacus TaxID=2714955 RepID=UPI00140A083F|nr:alkaline phosphatase D family protein [Motilibacter aurantiacus]NHC46639.1 alkaline phosphatase [Motilibacter aurantiacus]